jgi:hypothetical protein
VEKEMRETPGEDSSERATTPTVFVRHGRAIVDH